MTALTPAERILKSLGIEAPGEIDLEAIAWTRGAVVDYRPLDRCEATIVGSKRKAVAPASCSTEIAQPRSVRIAGRLSLAISIELLLPGTNPSRPFAVPRG
jgi:hypothetical protein